MGCTLGPLAASTLGGNMPPQMVMVTVTVIMTAIKTHRGHQHFMICHAAPFASWIWMYLRLSSDTMNSTVYHNDDHWLSICHRAKIHTKNDAIRQKLTAVSNLLQFINTRKHLCKHCTQYIKLTLQLQYTCNHQFINNTYTWRCGAVVECWPRDQEVAGSILGRVHGVKTLGKFLAPMCLCHQAV